MCKHVQALEVAGGPHRLPIVTIHGFPNCDTFRTHSMLLFPMMLAEYPAYSPQVWFAWYIPGTTW